MLIEVRSLNLNVKSGAFLDILEFFSTNKQVDSVTDK